MRTLKELDLTYPQYVVMLALWECDGITVRDLGEKLHLDSGTLSPLLRRLEIIGYITRERSEEDSRVVLIHLSDQGQELRAEAGWVQSCLIDSLGLSREEMDTLRSLAQKATKLVHEH